MGPRKKRARVAHGRRNREYGRGGVACRNCGLWDTHTQAVCAKLKLAVEASWSPVPQRLVGSMRKHAWTMPKRVEGIWFAPSIAVALCAAVQGPRCDEILKAGRVECEIELAAATLSAGAEDAGGEV